MFDTTALNIGSFTWQLSQADVIADDTFRNVGIIQRDFIGEPEEHQEIVLRAYGKYAGNRSLTKALLSEKAIEKAREDLRLRR